MFFPVALAADHITHIQTRVRHAIRNLAMTLAAEVEQLKAVQSSAAGVQSSAGRREEGRSLLHGGHDHPAWILHWFLRDRKQRPDDHRLAVDILEMILRN